MPRRARLTLPNLVGIQRVKGVRPLYSDPFIHQIACQTCPAVPASIYPANKNGSDLLLPSGSIDLH